ncbi:MAG: TauD/TfdA family dioxygenase [Gammaproteobacteria bacterium]|nr:TauD/TfdA family dioxygenase [Gammaproteobacteria bacterium]
MDYELRRLSPALGAEIIGLDVARPLSDADFARLRADWIAADGVLVLRDQRLSEEQHLAFSRRFGPLFGEAEHLQDTVKKYLHPEHPGIYRVSNKVRDGQPLGRARAGTYWHSDVSFRERPAMASLLYAIEIPPYGGDTLFASMYRAWEALSPAMRAALEPLDALHDFAVAASVRYESSAVEWGDLDGMNRSLHPVVITHPESGRRAVFVNPGFTAGLHGFNADESRAILDYLQSVAVRPEHVYRHRWQPRDLVIWDNRCVMHYAIADYQGLGDRYMHRTTVIAERPARSAVRPATQSPGRMPSARPARSTGR